MIDFKEFLNTAKIQAIANLLHPDEIAVWRSMCRSYSETYSTPLHLCLDGTIDGEEILLAVYEKQLDNFKEERDLENILEQIYTIEDPTYEKKKEEEVLDFIAEAEREEAERIKAGKLAHHSMKEDPTKKPLLEKPAPLELPKSGGINLAYLAKEEEEG